MIMFKCRKKFSYKTLLITGGGILLICAGQQGSTAPISSRCSIDVGMDTQITRNPQSVYEPWLAVNPNDPENLIASVINYDSSLKGAHQDVSFFHTLDGGKSWQPTILHDAAGKQVGHWEGAGDPIVTFS